MRSMLKLSSVGVATLLAAIAFEVGLASQTPSRAVAITHARLFDVRNGSIQPDMTIVVRGRTIASVGTTPPPADADVLDARGRVVLPGLTVDATTAGGYVGLATAS